MEDFGDHPLFAPCGSEERKSASGNLMDLFPVASFNHSSMCAFVSHLIETMTIDGNNLNFFSTSPFALASLYPASPMRGHIDSPCI